MNKRTHIENANTLTVDITALQGMLSVGKNTADDIGEKAGAVIRIGRRKLYNVKKVEAYLEQITEV